MHKYLNNFLKIIKMLRRNEGSRTASKPAAEVDAEHAVAVQPDSWTDLTVGWNQNGIVPHNIAEVRRRIDTVGSSPDAVE